MTRGKALLLIPYFGSFGPWFPLYLHTLAKQRTLDLLLLSDGPPPELPANARRVEMTLDRLRALAAAKLARPVRLERTRNICDLRPAYGLIFDEFIRGYEYWGYGDEDVLYGDLDRMLAPDLDGTVDLVVPSPNGKSGHLTLIRNAPRTNELVMSDPAYNDVLVSQEHWAYDETSWRWGSEISSFHKIVSEREARGELLVRRGHPRISGVPKPGRWYVYDGQRVHEDNGSELLYYHWGRMRHQNVRWPSAEEGKNGFAFDRYGFYDPKIGPASQLVRRGIGRVQQVATDTRRRLSEWRAAMRATNVRPAAEQADANE